MNVLIADDEDQIRHILTRFLAVDGYHVVSAENRENALAAARRFPFDIAFIDVGLGVESGLALARELSEICPALCIIMMSGDPTNAAIVAQAGFGALLPKPFDFSAARSRIQLMSKQEPARDSKFLIIEDDPKQLAAYSIAIEKIGFVVTRAQSAEEGVKLAQGTRFDIILSDNVLPGMTGVRSIAEYKKCSKSPVFIMTSHYSEDGRKDAELLGAAGYLKKPLDLEWLQGRFLNAIAPDA